LNLTSGVFLDVNWTCWRSMVFQAMFQRLETQLGFPMMPRIVFIAYQVPLVWAFASKRNFLPLSGIRDVGQSTSCCQKQPHTYACLTWPLWCFISWKPQSWAQWRTTCSLSVLVNICVQRQLTVLQIEAQQHWSISVQRWGKVTVFTRWFGCWLPQVHTVCSC
jgi:hypothetical protein